MGYSGFGSVGAVGGSVVGTVVGAMVGALVGMVGIVAFVVGQRVLVEEVFAGVWPHAAMLTSSMPTKRNRILC